MNGQEGRPAVREAMALEPGHLLAEQRSELGQQPGLADPGLADEQERLAPSRLELRRRSRTNSPTSRSRPTSGRIEGAREGARGPVSREARTGSARPLTGVLAERLEREAVREPPRGLVADRDRARSRSRLDPGGNVRRVAERDRLRAARAHRADARPTGVDADADGEVGNAPGLGDVARVVADHLQDAQGRTRRALRVVLVRVRDAEVRADAVSLVRLDRAAVLLDRLAHLRHALADERLHLVRREPLAERGRADDVGEQHGDGAQLVLAPGRLSAAAVRAAEQARRPLRARGLSSWRRIAASSSRSACPGSRPSSSLSALRTAW